ncbi:F-box/FBD/LRR-repeat protein At1g16930, partial [Linum perenne]
RLSNLPDVIIHHIFSFLDIKYVVQTSVLSRVWRCVWKHAPVLNFRRDSFRDTQIFIKFVNMVLDHRYQLQVCKISFVDISALWNWFPKSVYKITGPQLRSLKLDDIYRSTAIVAPRLEFLGLLFSVGHYVEDYQGFSKSSIPSLVHADILVLESYLDEVLNMECCLVNLFQVLHNAKSLVIRSDDDQVYF